MPSILFVCRANRYRSPIAAAALKDVLIRKNKQEWEVSSAGTWTTDGLPPVPAAIVEAQALGLNIRDHQSRIITPEIVHRADLILVMEQDQKEALQVEFPVCSKKIMLLTELVGGKPDDIIDPMKHPGRIVGSQIQQLIETGFDSIFIWVMGRYE